MVLTAKQLGISAGESQPSSPWLFCDEAASPAGGVAFYAIVEPARPGSEEFCEQLLEAISKVFRSRKRSLTGGLLQALKAANEDLRDWNRRSLKEHWIAAGVTCLALRDGEGYMAQVAPANSLLCRDGSVLLVTPAIPEAAEPLGINDDFWPYFSRLDLSGDAKLLLCTSDLPEGVSFRDIAPILTLPSEDILAALYRQVRAARDFAALLLTQQAPSQE